MMENGSMYTLYLLTEWEGGTGKYFTQGNGAQTERSEVHAP